MRKTIWKYQLGAGDYTHLDLPKGAKLLTVNEQHGDICLWCMVDPNEIVYQKRTFRLAGTGHPIEDNAAYIGTFYLHGGSLVFHLLEVTNANPEGDA